MKPKKRQKMCYHCEGEVDLDVIVCPFCAADLREEKPEQQGPSYVSSVKNFQAQQSLYPSPKTSQETPEPSQVAALPEENEAKSIFGPTLLLALGAQLLLFGIFMFFFSHEGILSLRWDARFWFLYVIASIPLLIFGYKSASKL